MFISLDHLGKDFPKKLCALDGLTLDLPSGMIGLIGPNGAGTCACGQWRRPPQAAPRQQPA